ncbi:hypothetical protein GCM10010464_57290 [Pseudonocardia yunnanensis]|uniref:DUF6924 domain-containing protein n=1 Tax=Pseudonocardia yunnanensis TaxID=58107 RepID=A0ABW4EX67_9PSEU
MATLTRTGSAPVLRTDFSDQQAWLAVRAAIVAPSDGDGFLADVEFIDDPAFDGWTTQQILAMATREAIGFQSCIFVVDRITLTSADRPVLVIDLLEERGREFRTVASELYQIENNLSISNMDFFEFADAVQADGVFRGF